MSLFNMLKGFAKVKEDLDTDFNDVEVELRVPIVKPKDFKCTRTDVVTYYTCNHMKMLTFRSRNDFEIETKEIYDKIKIKNMTLAVSIEKSYLRRNFKFQLNKSNTRTINVFKVQDNPLVEIKECNKQYLLEIEFDMSNYMEVEKIINKYKNSYWPTTKPMEISSNTLARKIMHTDQWVISPKADGSHVLIYENNDKTIFIYDNGNITDINKNDCDIIEPINIYEGELMEDNSFLIFDCLCYNKKNICKLNYIERRKNIKNNKKEAYVLENSEGLKDLFDIKYDYPIDGYIITNNRNRKLIYKSKFKPTVDLRYRNGYLLLEQEYETRNKYTGDKELKENCIYEFDKKFNLIRYRPDKTIANFKMPYDDNPLYKITYGVGAPSLRNFHNKIKFELLSKLKGDILLDIGSNEGGDSFKWDKLRFKRIYAVDPNLNIKYKYANNKIIQIRTYAQDIPKNIKYNAVSIFFVPWNKYFKEYIEKYECVLILMTRPINYECKIFSCKVENNKVILKIHNTNSASYIEEEIPDIKIDSKYEIKYKLDFGTNDEKVLQNMYQYYYINRK
nr:mRNA capping enzyme [Saccharomycopsis selenospora]